ncbi:low molecular weight protein arginine phosphatase [Staphylococcus hyicus]|uniref:low molecular weight protein arginine phosphatase n=1 Tax=Staphylococcus hyicus TaxID=1284 RepID=UPI00208DFD90|nr:low molecular weight protein arginine phosphatase [Staphylococcus hyicus]MCO4329368.1 low molecular weight protein arginine phosphatase [Staphylococcus hyicus]MCO4336650.1 low molecular weight protein arginine phosphatase [Staphylococcus hyicus]
MRIIFVCTGNTCRSPMAESIATQILPHHQIESRGLMAIEGQPIASHTLEVLRTKNYPQPTSAQPFQYEDLTADLILTMTVDHKKHIECLYGMQQHVHTLKDYINQSADIPDPFGGPLEHYQMLFEQLEKDIFKLKEQID